MTLPTSAFAASFRAHVVPRLVPLIIVCAVKMAIDDMSFPDAMSEITKEARKFGSTYLPELHHDAFREWVATKLLDEWLLAETRHEEHRAAMAPLHDDIDRWNEVVVYGTSYAGVS